MSSKEQELEFTFWNAQSECCEWLYTTYIKPHMGKHERLVSISSDEKCCNYIIAQQYTISNNNNKGNKK